MPTIILKNCSLLDTKNKTMREHYHVLIRDNLIKIVSDKPIECEDATVIDLEGKTLTPGFIDAHVHVTATTMDLKNDHIPTTEITAQAIKFLEEMLQRGFTSVRDAGGADSGLANAISKGTIQGPRLFFSGKALSQTGGHGDFRKPNKSLELCSCAHSASTISVIADGVDQVRKAAREELRQGATQIKIMASGGVASPTDKITNLQYSIDEIKAIVEEATSWGTYVMAHAYTPEAIIRCVQAGVRTIEHGNLLNQEAATVMAKYGAYLVPTLITYKAVTQLGPKFNFPPESLAKVDSVQKSGLDSIKIARSSGVKIGFGSDLLGVEGQRWQTEEFIIRSAIEEPIDTMLSATSINAEILQHAGKLGEITEGAYADLLVFDENPLQNISVLTKPEHLKLVMKDGVIYKNTLSKHSIFAPKNVVKEEVLTKTDVFTSKL